MPPVKTQGARAPWARRIVLPLLAVLVVASVVGLLTYSPVGTRSAVFVGDSYTHGTGASDQSRRWTSLVAASQGWQETNLGLGGTGYLSTATKNGCGQTYCASYREVAARAVQLKPDIVVVAGGQNDFTAFGRDPAAVSAAIDETFATLRRGLPKAEIIAVGPSTPGGVSGSVVALDAAVRTAATSVDATYVSLITPDSVIRPEMVVADGAHVDDAGHRAIADRVIRGLA